MERKARCKNGIQDKGLKTLHQCASECDKEAHMFGFHRCKSFKFSKLAKNEDRRCNCYCFTQTKNVGGTAECSETLEGQTYDLYRFVEGIFLAS